MISAFGDLYIPLILIFVSLMIKLIVTITIKSCFVKQICSILLTCKVSLIYIETPLRKISEYFSLKKLVFLFGLIILG